MSLAVKCLSLPMLALVAFSLSSEAKADDHGCQVLLCLANPGGATQYAACVPPITKLYQDLAKGKAFPTCSGGGMETSAPVSDPYYCAGGHVLDYDKASPVCRSAARTETVECPVKGDDTAEKSPFDPVTAIEGGREVCKTFAFSDVKRNEKPTYIDVTIASTGKKTRVRF